jgi:hypothetical protein
VAASKIRVVPAYDPRGSLVWSAVFGGACGLLYLGPGALLSINGAGALSGLLGFCFLVPGCALIWQLLPLILALPFALRFARHCQRVRQTYLVGLVFGTSFILMPSLISFWGTTALISGLRDLLWIGVFLLWALLIGSVFGLLNLLLRWIVRSSRYVLLEQDGTLCWTCGYPVGRVEGAMRCSECGLLFDRQRTDRSWLARLTRAAKRHSRVVLALLCVSFVAMIGHRLVTISLPKNAMFDRVSKEGSIFRGHMFNAAASAKVGWTPAYGWEATGLCVELPDESIMHLIIMYEPNPGPGQPFVQLQLAPATAGAFGSLLPGFANPFIVCDLTEAQTELVREHGLPSSLIDALKKTAVDAGWTPMTPGIAPTQTIAVPADEHFQTFIAPPPS